MDRADKAKIIITLIFRILLLLAAVLSAFQKNWLNVLLASLTFFMTFLPSMAEKRFKIDYPSEFEILILLFIFASMFLGEINDFYYKFWWWDIFLHMLSGVIIAIFAFTLVLVLNKQKNIIIDLSPVFIALFAFCFSMTIAGLWEIFEFSMDTFFRLTMQKSGLVDTMTDLIVCAIGSAVVSVLGYLYLKLKPKINIISHSVDKLFRQNRKWFKD